MFHFYGGIFYSLDPNAYLWEDSDPPTEIYAYVKEQKQTTW